MDPCDSLQSGMTSFEKDFIDSAVHFTEQRLTVDNLKSTLVFLGAGDGRAEVCFAMLLSRTTSFRWVRTVVLVDLQGFSAETEEHISKLKLPFDVKFVFSLNTVLNKEADDISAIIALNMGLFVTGSDDSGVYGHLRQQLGTYVRASQLKLPSIAFNYIQKSDRVLVKVNFIEMIVSISEIHKYRPLGDYDDDRNNKKMLNIVGGFWTDERVPGTEVLTR